MRFVTHEVEHVLHEPGGREDLSVVSDTLPRLDQRFFNPSRVSHTGSILGEVCDVDDGGSWSPGCPSGARGSLARGAARLRQRRPELIVELPNEVQQLHLERTADGAELE